MTDMRRIGITGGIGSGKTEVTNIIRKKGYLVIDADEISRELAKPGEPVLDRLREEIGDSVFFENGNLHRKALAKLMFNNPDILRTVNGIFHTEIKKRIADMVSRADSDGRQVVFISAPLLLESGTDDMVDEIWLVTADENIRINRTKERDDVSEADVFERIQSQMPDSEKRDRADIIIENNGSLELLHSKIEEVLSFNGL